MPDPVASVLAFPLRSTGAGCDPELYKAWNINPGGPPIFGALSDLCPKREPVPRFE
jgi:hypothetical protein